MRRLIATVAGAAEEAGARGHMLKPFRGTVPKIAETAFIEESAQIIGDVEVGAHSSVWFNCVVRGDCNSIRIGEYTNIQDGSVVHVTVDMYATTVGSYVTVGHSVVLHGCTVGDHCLIGIGAIVLDNVTVGENSLVAAGSLLTPGTIIPPNSLVMGSPARVRRGLTDEERSRIDQNWRHYVEYKSDYAEQSRS